MIYLNAEILVERICIVWCRPDFALSSKESRKEDTVCTLVYDLSTMMVAVKVGLLLPSNQTFIHPSALA